jgi:hypothetical protein
MFPKWLIRLVITIKLHTDVDLIVEEVFACLQQDQLFWCHHYPIPVNWGNQNNKQSGTPQLFANYYQTMVAIQHNQLVNQVKACKQSTHHHGGP